MAYETVYCGDHTCPCNKNGACKFNAFEEIPCQEMSEEEFEEFKTKTEEGE